MYIKQCIGGNHREWNSHKEALIGQQEHTEREGRMEKLVKSSKVLDAPRTKKKTQGISDLES